MALFGVRMLLLLGLLVASPVPSSAQKGGPPDWELTPLGEPVTHLFTPASGAFFAQTQHGLQRSDDGGGTWFEVSLGPASTFLAIDPTNHAVLYAADAHAVYKSTDEASTWHQLATTPHTPVALAVSAADPNLLYLVGAAFGDVEFLRSRDGGSTWLTLETHQFSLCTWSVLILQPHPTDANRVWRSVRCLAGREFGAPLEHSVNQGESWTPTFNPMPFDPPQLGYPMRIVGGQGAEPTRWYLAVNRDRRLSGSALYRSDDDGDTWTEILSNPADVSIGGLAYDPSNPDRVVVGTRSFPSLFEPPHEGGVVATTDGGLTWSPLGRQDIGPVNDLALGIDGLNLYAATDHGLWRLNLGCACIW